MIQNAILALTALSSLTGSPIKEPIKENYRDYETIARKINSKVIVKNGDIEVNNCSLIKDIYDLDGINRYIQIKTPSEYFIYDKITKEFVCSGVDSPFENHEQEFNVFVDSKNDEDGYLSFDGDDFVILNRTKVGSTGLGVTLYPYIPAPNAKLISNHFYFERLYNNIVGCDGDLCTVSASATLLGYYDTFVNDMLVKEENDSIKSRFNSDNVMDFEVSPGYGFRGLGFIPEGLAQELIEASISASGENPVGVGLTVNEHIKMFKKYINDSKIECTVATCEGNLSDRANNRTEKMIKNAIDNNRPLILDITNHAFVCFGYDSNYIHCLNLFGDCSSIKWKDVKPTIFEFAHVIGAIDITSFEEHVHSNQYINSSTGNFVCPCGHISKKYDIDLHSFGFTNTYSTNEYESTFSVEGIDVSFRAKRCGYFNNEYIGLSCRNANVQEAYLELSFSKTIDKIFFDTGIFAFNDFSNKKPKVEFDVFNKSTNKWKIVTTLRDKATYPNYTSSYAYIGSDIAKVRFYCSDIVGGVQDLGRIIINKISFQAGTL